jgi:hypothetical protein
MTLAGYISIPATNTDKCAESGPPNSIDPGIPTLAQNNDLKYSKQSNLIETKEIQTIKHEIWKI